MTSNFNSPSALHAANASNPKVLIVGAGLGGLTLAILLEKAKIDYEIYERSTTLRPLGSGTSLSPNVLPLLEQLGLYKGLQTVWKEMTHSHFFKETETGEIELSLKTDALALQEITGYPTGSMSRPDLHSFLMSHVPSHKIHLGKRVLSISQDIENGVLIRTSDGMTHEGDILVGSDGAYSGVRQSLFKQMAEEKSLPSSDGESLKICYMSVLGTSNPIDTSIMPSLEYGRCHIVTGYNKPNSWRCFEAPGNRLCWRVDAQLQSSSFEQTDAFKSTDWGSESTGAIQEEWRSFKFNIGVDGAPVTVGALIDATETENITKVMLEEKLYTTWYHHRTVLMGDSCHKMLPNAARGAVNAMLDAVILANAIYEIADNATYKNIQSAFKEYYNERYPLAKADLESSQRMSKLVAGQNWFDNLFRKIIFTFFPSMTMRYSIFKSLEYRPQASFLPKIPYRGSGNVKPQKESKRYLREKASSREP
ncbi:hypothetical protein BGZ49_001459 [Haplosporangium sp. Z 27]|nr:hypothetical protein BGZ49_001459 [Haplosporangium sp. Z 27]